MCQLHYHHSDYVSPTISVKKKQTKQIYYFHPRQPNNSSLMLANLTVIQLSETLTSL